MPPELFATIEDLQQRLAALESVENISFIKNVQRRAGTGLRQGTSTVPSSITQTVRDSSGTTTVNVAKVPDNKRQIILSDGSVEYVGTYLS
jgi:hypothetical protein